MEGLKRLSAEYGKENILVSVSGRTYDMHGAFPASVKVGGEEILAAPIALRAKYSGEEQPWDAPHIVKVSECAEEMVYTVQQSAGNAFLNARVKIEQDGLIWIDMMMVPFGRWITYHMGEDLTVPTLTSLKLEIPLTRKAAELYHYWPILASGIDQTAQINNSGTLTEEGLALPLKPVLWLGREECGFAFYMESPKNAQPADMNRMYTVRTEGDTVILTIDLLDSMPRDWANVGRDSWYTPLQPVEFTMGMQATPVKPYVRRKDFERVFHRDWATVSSMTGDELEAYCDTLRDLGVKWHTFHEDWTMIQNYGLAWDEDAFRKVVDALHRRDIKVMVYFGYECSTMVPMWFEKKDNFLMKAPDGRIRGGWQRLPHQRDYIVCYGGDYSEVMRERVAYVMDNYGVDGIYTDSTYIPQDCANEAHGCGWRDENGELHTSFPVRKLREHVKKLHEVVHSRGGIVEAHQSSCCSPMLLAFADSYFDGEHIQHLFANQTGSLMNTGAMRSEFSGVNFGVPFQFLSITETYNEGFGIMLLHNSCTKVYGKNGMDRLRQASALWRRMDEFGADDAEFIGYWQENCPVRSHTEGVLASAWVRHDGTMFLAVNMTKETVHARFTLYGKEYEADIAPSEPVFFSTK
ncbi:MAG: hypothetical protein IJE08_05570 [Clostridia bacterium]|nr:hypothetical protein [Clostridia bacterium]